MNRKEIIRVSLLVLILISFARFFLINSTKFISRYDISYWEKEFSNSQVVKGGRAEHFFSDGELYAILGYKYILGQNPAQLHPEVPPFGKYLIGLGIYFFGNENATNIILSVGSLSLLYIISYEIFRDGNLALIVVLLETLDTQFQELITSPNLDIPQLFLLLLSLLLFLKSQGRIKAIFLSGIFAGLAMATKFFVNGFILLCVYLVGILAKKDFKIFIRSLSILPGALLGYVLPYIVTILNDPNPIHFFKFQRWLINWWAGNAQTQWGGILSIIATGTWKTWWEDNGYIHVSAWNPLWPIIATMGLLSIISIGKLKDWKAFVIWIWCGFYLLFISTTSAFPRYLMALFPFLNLLTVYTLNSLFAMFTRQHRNFKLKPATIK